jgi:hypothetical protein
MNERFLAVSNIMGINFNVKKTLFMVFLMAAVSGMYRCGSDEHGGGSGNGTVVYKTDFNAINSFPTEVDFIITDYPVGTEAFHEISTGLVQLPSDVAAGQALKYSANNHSDDIDSNLIFSFSSKHDLTPNTHYNVQATFSFFSQVPTGCAGVGGAPDAVLFRVCASADPTSKVRIVDSLNTWRLPLGNATCGNAGNIGTPAKDCTQENNPWSIQVRTSETFQAKSSGDGSLFISISTHSGFEATSTFYYKEAHITLTPVP